jgi:hypothetical protein
MKIGDRVKVNDPDETGILTHGYITEIYRGVYLDVEFDEGPTRLIPASDVEVIGEDS